MANLRRRAFTLIELLVILAVASIAAVLVLPILQSARETSRRARCMNNCKQLGQALHQYHQVHLSFPAGRIWNPGAPGCGYNFFQCQDTSWFEQMLPHFEEQPLANAFNYNLGVGSSQEFKESPKLVGLFANSTAASTRLMLFQCPSDRPADFRITPAYKEGALSGPRLSKGNYAVSWGNTQWDQADLTIDGKRIPFLKSAFGQTETISISKITDGTSCTAIMGELLEGDTYDIRGFIWQSVAGGSLYMSRLLPNSTDDIYGTSNGGDAIHNAMFCVDQPDRGLPCTGGIGDRMAYAGVRSHHPGGVNVLYGDGSVRFILDKIDPMIWIALNSISGGETIDSDTY